MSELPNGWTATKLKNTTLTRKGKKPQQLKSTADTGFVPYLDIRAIETNEIRQFADVKSSRLATKNDVLMVWDGARSGWVGIGKEGAIGSTIMALESLCGDPHYLYYFLQSSFDELNSNTRGTGIPHVDPDIYNELLVPVAPLNEQRRIVAKLETLLSKVDVCQQRLAKFPRLLKRFRQAVLAAACSGRLTADWRNDLSRYSFIVPIQIGFPEAEELPHQWRRTNLVDVAKLESGHTPRKTVPEYWDNGDVPWISLQDIRAAHGRIITDTKLKPTMHGINNSSARLLPKGTVCFSRDISVGYVTVMGREMATTQHFANWVCDPEVENLFLMYAFMASRENLIASGQGSTVGTIYMPELKQFTVVLPPIPEQQEIVRRVEALFRLADQLEARYHKAKAHVDKLQQAILAKAFRGELVPQDPNDEPASVLLERLRAERATQSESKPKRSKAGL